MNVSIPLTQEEKRELVAEYQESEHKERCAQGSSKAKFIEPCTRATRNGMVGRPSHLQMYLREQLFDETDDDEDRERNNDGTFQ